MRLVVLRSETDAWVEDRKVTYSCDLQEELPQQMMNLADHLHHQLDGLELVAAVLRDRDHSPGGVNRQHLKVDHTADGVVLAALRRACVQTYMFYGNRIGELCGSDKATIEQEAAERFGNPFREAGAAALAAASLSP